MYNRNQINENRVGRNSLSIRTCCHWYQLNDAQQKLSWKKRGQNQNWQKPSYYPYASNRSSIWWVKERYNYIKESWWKSNFFHFGMFMVVRCQPWNQADIAVKNLYLFFMKSCMGPNIWWRFFEKISFSTAELWQDYEQGFLLYIIFFRPINDPSK